MVEIERASILPNLAPADKVIFTHHFEYTVAHAVGTTYNFTIPTADKFTSDYGLLPFGRFSIDGGTTYLELASNFLNLFDPVFPVEGVISSHTLDGIGLSFWISVAVPGAGSDINIIGDFGLLDHGLGTLMMEASSFFGQKAAYDSRGNAPKIHMRGTLPRGTNPIPIAHNLGYVPDVRIFDTSEYAGGSLTLQPTPAIYDDNSAFNTYYVDETELIIKPYPAGATDDRHYIIYLREDT